MLISIFSNFNTTGMQSVEEETKQLTRKRITENLYYAVLDNDTETAAKLLNSGLADPNSTDAKVGGYQNETMLEKAVENNNEVLTRLLLAQGANPNFKTPHSFTFPLNEAIKNRNETLVDLLLKAGASPNAWNATPDTSIDLLTKQKQIWFMAQPTIITAAEEENNTKILQKILDAGADIDAQEAATARTALMNAAFLGNTSNVQFLLEQGANPGLKDASGKTALDLAIEKNHLEAAQLFKQATSKIK